MNYYDNEKLLIISNNVLSLTNNNGKTIYSYIDILDKENVAQLYFSAQNPVIEGYRYYQITDLDVIKGVLFPKRRGREVCEVSSEKKIYSRKKYISKNNLSRVVREILWLNRWKSSKLQAWLDNFNPTAVFFVGGDSGFAYSIYNYIVKRYNAKSSLYITDDYIMPRKNEGFISLARRKYIYRKLKKSLVVTDHFFTISDAMQKEYKKIFNRDSGLIVNMTESLKRNEIEPDDATIILLYAGSLYYGRDKMLGDIARAVEKYNETHRKKALLQVYTNAVPDLECREKFVIEGAAEYMGSLSKEELVIALNKAHILVFVESFDEEQIEKTKYSLSTKVPEYMSVERPIFAVGPKGIGSMDYLNDVAICVHSKQDIESRLTEVLDSEKIKKDYAKNAFKKYIELHNKKKLQEEFLRIVFSYGK